MWRGTRTPWWRFPSALGPNVTTGKTRLYIVIPFSDDDNNNAVTQHSNTVAFYVPDINECEDPAIASRCVQNAECCNLPSHFLCKCKPGFVGDGEVECKGNATRTRVVDDGRYARVTVMGTYNSYSVRPPITIAFGNDTLVVRLLSRAHTLL